MGKPPSIETQLRTVKAELRTTYRERDDAEKQLQIQRQRAAKAEAELAEWKQRFDILLRRDGAKP